MSDAAVPCSGLTTGVILTVATILTTREHYAALAEACISAAEAGPGAGGFRVNDLPRYVAWQRDIAGRTRAGEFDHSFTHRQYGHWVQTGVSVPFLSTTPHPGAEA